MSCCRKDKKDLSTEQNKKTDIPIHIATEDGKKWNIFGVRITGKILSNKTNGDYSVIVTETPS